MRRPCFFASSSVAASRSGRRPMSLRPSARSFACAATQARAASGVASGVLLPRPKNTYAKSRGAVISLRALCARASTIQARPFPLPGIAHGRDAVAHPELEDVLGGRALVGAAHVAVHVDEARQQVVSGEVDLVVARLRLGPVGRVDGDAGVADALDAARCGSARPPRRPDRTAGAPVPSTIVTPRRMSRFHGPSPSARGGALGMLFASSCANAEHDEERQGRGRGGDAGGGHAAEPRAGQGDGQARHSRESDGRLRWVTVRGPSRVTDRGMDDGEIDVEALYRRYGPMVLRRCRRLLRDEDDALEVAQEVFVSLVKNRQRLADRFPSALLFRMATNLSLNRHPSIAATSRRCRATRSCTGSPAGRTSTRRCSSTRSSAASPSPRARWRSSTSSTA